MSKFTNIIRNKYFEIIVNEAKKKSLPKNISGDQYFYNCTINRIGKKRLVLNEENVDLIKKAMLKLIKQVKSQIKQKNKLTYLGEISISFKNLKKKWIRSPVFNINSAYYKNIVYSAINQIGKFNISIHHLNNNCCFF